MGVREFLFGDPPPSAAPSERKDVLTADPRLFWLPGNPYNPTGAMATDDRLSGHTAYAASALVYACMTFRATKLIEAPLWIAEERDLKESWLTDNAHPIAALLEQPNPDESMSEFLLTLSLYMDMGAALVVKFRDGAGRPARLEAFRFDQFTVEAATVRTRGRRVPEAHKFGKFIVTGDEGRQAEYGPDDVCYFPPPGGVAPLDAALVHVTSSTSMRSAIKSALARSIRPGSVTTIDGSLEAATFDRFKTQLSALYGGAENAGKNLVLEQGATFTPLNADLKALDTGSVDATDEASICMAFQVHPALVGARIALENSSGLSDSLKPALTLFYDLVLFPRWKRLEMAFTKGLLREVDDNPLRFVRFDTEEIRALAPDMTAKINEAKAATGIMTLDEQRGHLGLQPLEDETGDVIAPAAGTGQARADGGPQGAGATEPKALAPGIERKNWTPAAMDVAWATFNKKAAGKEPDYQRAATALFADEAARVRATLLGAVPGRKADPDPTLAQIIDAAIADPYVQGALIQVLGDYAQGGAVYTAWLERFTQLIATTVEVTGTDFAAAIGLSFGMDRPAVVSAIRQRAQALATNVTDTTAGLIEEAVSEGRRLGESVEQIAKRITRDTFGEIALNRARTIARTETVGAINEAEWLAATESGVMQSKRWLHERTGQARPSHLREQSSPWQPLNSPFPVTGKMRPGDGIGGAKEDVNCYVPGTEMRGVFLGGLRAEYAGDVVEIATAGGRRLTVTPNHPVLTPRGFVPAHALCEGDDVLGYTADVDGASLGDADEQDRPAPVEQILESLALMRPTGPRHLSVHDLHGDAVAAQRDVEIVGPNGMLLYDTRESAPPEFGGDRILVLAASQEPSRDGSRALALHGEGIDLAAAGSPRGGTLTLDNAPIALTIAPFEALRVGLPAECDPRTFEAEADRYPAVPGSVAESLERLAAQIRVDQLRDLGADVEAERLAAEQNARALDGTVERGRVDASLADEVTRRFAGRITSDKIAQVARRHYTGHVYDLQSVTGWNIAGGIVTSNCRCLLIYSDQTADEANAESKARDSVDSIALLAKAVGELAKREMPPVNITVAAPAAPKSMTREIRFNQNGDGRLTSAAVTDIPTES